MVMSLNTLNTHTVTPHTTVPAQMLTGSLPRPSAAIVFDELIQIAGEKQRRLRMRVPTPILHLCELDA